MKTTSFGPDFGPFGPNSGSQFFLSKISSVTRCYGQRSSCTISGKTNDPILRKLRDEQRTGGRTDGQMDDSDFIAE